MTKIFLYFPERTKASAVDKAKTNPEHAADKSKATALSHPSAPELYKQLKESSALQEPSQEESNQHLRRRERHLAMLGAQPWHKYQPSTLLRRANGASEFPSGAQSIPASCQFAPRLRNYRPRAGEVRGRLRQYLPNGVSWVL